MILESQVTILVKASPQPSKKHSETVCCAGLKEDGTWQRLFPIRFRRLKDDKAFKRWSIVKFQYRRPNDDNRLESCRVHEESISLRGEITRDSEKSSLVERALVASEKEATGKNQSLAVIRPENVSLTWKKLAKDELENAKMLFARQANQLSLLDDEIAAYEPCPYKFSMYYEDEGGPHTKTCADWETSAAFFNLRAKYDEQIVLQHLQNKYCEQYVKKGLVFALGNMKKRPQTWQLLGIFPVKDNKQPELF